MKVSLLCSVKDFFYLMFYFVAKAGMLDVVLAVVHRTIFFTLSERLFQAKCCIAIK